MIKFTVIVEVDEEAEGRVAALIKDALAALFERQPEPQWLADRAKKKGKRK